MLPSLLSSPSLYSCPPPPPPRRPPLYLIVVAVVVFVGVVVLVVGVVVVVVVFVVVVVVLVVLVVVIIVVVVVVAVAVVVVVVVTGLAYRKPTPEPTAVPWVLIEQERKGSLLLAMIAAGLLTGTDDPRFSTMTETGAATLLLSSGLDGTSDPQVLRALQLADEILTKPVPSSPPSPSPTYQPRSPIPVPVTAVDLFLHVCLCM